MKTTATFIPIFVFLFFALSILFTPAQSVFGQITVTQSSFGSILNSEIDVETISNSDSDPIIALIDQAGEDQTWDLSALAVEDSVISTGTMQFLTSFSGKPGADNEHFQDANIMVQSNSEMTFFVDGSEMTLNLVGYDYGILNESEISSYGNFQADGSDPDNPERRVFHTPKNIIYSLPLTYGASWENDYTTEINEENIGQTTYEYSSTVTIDGWGEVVIGNVSIPVLRVMSTETSTIAGFDFTTIYVGFVNENGLEVAKLSVDQMTASEEYDPESANAQIISYDGLIPVSNEPEVDIPTSVGLHPNFPNPFNPATQISYQLNTRAEVTLTVYSLTGQKIQTLVDGELKQSGSHTVPFSAENLASGVYLYRLRAGDQSFTRKMTLLK